MAVFVLDKRGEPLMPCTEKRARLLLERGRARVHRVVPFVIRIVDLNVRDCALQPLQIKIDPGSKITGIALVREVEVTNHDTGEVTQGVAVLNLVDLVHRGYQISKALTSRRYSRRRRRSNLRYRKPRFNNRARKVGWLPPSLQHRVDTTAAWVERIRHWAPVIALSSELVRFDLQLLQNPKISGAQYQQGDLAGYEVREYLLEKWGRTCVYCGTKDAPLQVEHIRPRALGGSNRVSNLTLACQCCNQKKGARRVEDFLAKQPDLLRRILAQTKRPLKDAAAVNATCWALVKKLKASGLPVETASGGKTKYNRTRFKVPKTHTLDAVCVGDMDFVIDWQGVPTLRITCTGRGSYQRTLLNKYGFPRGYLTRSKSVKGFQTGDMVYAEVPKGKKKGAYTGRVAVRASGSFNIQTGTKVVQSISYRYCKRFQRADGYGYSLIANENVKGPRS